MLVGMTVSAEMLALRTGVIVGMCRDFLWTILNIASTTSFTHYTSVAIAISEFVQMVTSGLTVVWVKYPYILLLLPSFPTMPVCLSTNPALHVRAAQ